ncbi:MAG TPA: BON domain-containing protein [Burkholderiales bacterium]|nr:BON domain-containing protein [Burkholderiales bacterium]
MKPILAALVVATAAALGAAGCTSPGQQQRGTPEVSDDAALTAKVKTAIATDVGARAASSINVETYRGVVELSGFVDSREMASRALAAAKKVGGIKTLKNDLRVKAS